MALTKLPFDCRAGRMRLKLSLLLFAVFAFVPLANAQEENVTLLTREASIKTVFEQINSQTNYTVAADLRRLDTERRVLFSSTQLSVKDMLREVLIGTGFTWKVDGKYIAIIPEPATAADHPLYSTMYRSSLPQEMSVVHDPLSDITISAEELACIRNGFWRRSANSADSLGLAVLNFPVNSVSLNPDYMGNRQTIELINRTFSNRELLSRLDFITITGAASPEGRTGTNTRLAADRAMAIKNYMLKQYPFLDRDKVYTFSIGEDWTGLRKMVMDDKDTPMREQVLYILGQETNGDQKRAALQALDGGRVNKYITENMLPYLRGAVACMIYLKDEPKVHVDTLRLTDTIYVHTHEVIERVVTDTLKVEGSRYWALKTNLLYDAVLLPNLALEVDLGRRWSVEMQVEWAWWATRRTHRNSWRIQTGGIELRKWLGSKERTPLTGHYLGVYGMAGTYDVRRKGRTGYLSDMSYSFGITYGYAMPIARRLNLEFGVGAGYFGGKYKRYRYDEVSDCWPWLSDGKKSYFGLTKAKVSLVWLIGKGWNQDKKGK